MANRNILGLYLFFCLAICTTLYGQDVNMYKGTKDKLHIYLLIGQSNMAGRAPFTKEEAAVIPNCYLLNGEDEFEPAKNPLNGYSTIRKGLKKQKMNPGYSFSKAMLEKQKGISLGLVVNAKGGTKIEQWAKGTKFYNDALKRAKAAQKLGVFKGILWHQGESNENNPDGYLEALSTLVKDLRTDLGLPNLPFVAGQVKDLKVVNDQIAKLPQTVPFTAFASSEGLTTKDRWHFDAKGMKLLGERYAEEMLKLQTKSNTEQKSVQPTQAVLKQTNAQTKPDTLFILSGQSNMAGNGFFGDLPKTSEYSEYLSSPDNVSIWNSKLNKWEPLKIVKRFGPEIGFAHTLSKALPDKHIGIIKYAAGGTSMDKWNIKGPLYSRLLSDFRNAQKSVPNAILAAMLWHQGESDSGNKVIAEAYKAKFLLHINTIRKDTEKPNLLFIYGQINPGNSFRGRSRWGCADIIRNVQENLNLANTIMIKTDDCEKNAYIAGEAATSSERKQLKKYQDNVHYSAKGQIKMGTRFAETYLNRVK